MFVDKVQIQQVILNLIRNAIEAMAESPRRQLLISSGKADEQMAQTMGGMMGGLQIPGL